MRAMTHTRVAGMDTRKPLTALPASHRAKPPWLSPKNTAARRHKRCCGSTGQPDRKPTPTPLTPTKKPACLMAASTLDRCNKMPTPTTTVPLRTGPSLLHLWWPQTAPPLFFK